MKQDETDAIAQLLQKYSSGVILLPQSPSADTVSAATALYLALTKTGKNVGIACSTPVKSDIVGADKITSELVTAGDNLVISFPYQEGAIDKVDYNITGDRFNLIVTPRTKETAIDPKDVTFTKSGGQVEFVITLDSPSLKALGPIYADNAQALANKTIINIDRHLSNSFYGTANLVSKQAAATSEIVLGVITALGVELDADIATNLYQGILSATANFTSYSVTPDSLEAAAALLRAGAKKKGARKDVFTRPGQAPMPTVQPASQKEARAVETIEQEPEDDEDAAEADDWLKPKIFGETKN